MAIEHVHITDGSGSQIATDVVGSDNFQVVKLALGADGAMDNLVDAGPQAGSASVPVALSDEDNAVLDSIVTALVPLSDCLNSAQNDAFLVAGSIAVNNMLVATGDSSAAATGVLTLGSDGSNVRNLTTDAAGHLQIDVLSAPSTAVTNADITSCKTALELIDNSVDGNYLNVNMNVAGTDVAGGNGAQNAQTVRVTIASDSTGQVKLAASDGVDIGNVDVASVVTGTGATNLGKAEDAGHSSGDTGVMVLAVRDDTLAATSGSEGDYECLHTNNNGALYVEVCPGTMWTAFHNIAGGAHTDVELQAAPGANLSLYITDIFITNDATLATTVLLEEDTASAKTAKTATMYIPASGGISIPNMRTPIKLTANKNLGFTTTGTANTSLEVHGYTAP